MRTLILLLLISSLAFAQNITILHTGDSHSHLEAFGPKDSQLKGTIGGIGKIAYLIDQVRQSDPDALFVHAGDFFTGDIFFNKYLGVAELQLLKQIGLDAVTVGNHEFDHGPAILYNTLSQVYTPSTSPVISANLDFTNYSQLDPYIAPYVTKTVEGVKIGIFGLTIPTPLNYPAPVIVKDNIDEIISATTAAMQSENVDIIVCLSHLGQGWDMDNGVRHPELDIIIGGHDHHILTYNPPAIWGNAYILQSGWNYEYLGKLNFDYTNGTISNVTYNVYHAGASVPKLESVQTQVETYKQGIVSTYGDMYTKKLATATIDIEKFSGNPAYKDSPIGNLVTDAYKQKTKTNIALDVTGLITDKIYQGAVVGADIFRVAAYGYNASTGYGFNLIKVKMNGTEIIKGLEIALSQLNNTDYEPQVAGLTFSYNPNNPVGSRVIISSIRVNGSYFFPFLNYTVTVNDGLYRILTAYGVKIVGSPTYTNIPEYTAIKDFIVKLKNVNYVSQGRIKIQTSLDNYAENELMQNDAITKYSLFDNYPNPFNPSTTIKFSIPNDVFVTLKIYNSLGQEVKILVNDALNAGTHTYNFDAGNLSSGVYFYVLNAGSFTETKRMMFVK